jgi:membrane associated rhomboid family serine protease/Flp pilus assembly protein TadD
VRTPDSPPLNAELPATAPVPVSRQRLTTFIVMANIAVFLWTWWQGVSPSAPNIDRMRELGASFGPYVFSDRPWRLVTSNYLHFGYVHILTNLVCLWGLGRFAEEFYDWRDYFLLYTFGGVSGSLLSVYMHPFAVGAGASGAIFGIAGALLATLRWGNFYLDPQARRVAYAGVLKFAGLNLVLGFVLSIVGNVDNYGHMGGLIAGLLAGAVLSRRLGPSAAARRYRAIAWVALIVLFTTVYMAARGSRGFIPPIYYAERDLQAQRYDAVIAKMNGFTRQYPQFYEGHLLLGRALSGKQEHAAAAQAYGKAADAAPQLPQPLLLKAAAHRAAHEPLQAEATFRRLVALAPRTAEFHALLGGMLADEGKLAEAESELKQANELSNFGNPQVWISLANLHLAMGQPAPAIKEFAAARAKGGDAVAILQGLIRANQMLGNYGEAGRSQAELQRLTSPPPPAPAPQ